MHVLFLFCPQFPLYIQGKQRDSPNMRRRTEWCVWISAAAVLSFYFYFGKCVSPLQLDELRAKIQIISQCQGKKITNRYPVGYLILSGVTSDYALCLGSSETDSFLRPFRLLPDSIERPLEEDILSLNPCLFFLFLLDG